MSRAQHNRIAELEVPRSPVVLLLVDVINPLDFEGAAQLAPSALQAARACAVLRARCDRRRIQVVYANDNYGLWQSDFKHMLQHCRGRRGVSAQMTRLLQPRPGDITLLKPRHSAFHATPLALLLQQLHCKRLIVAGVAADSCVLFTAMDAYLRGHALWVPEDCTAAETTHGKEQALLQMQRVLKADIRPASGNHPKPQR